jgi:hypothetical protein
MRSDSCPFVTELCFSKTSKCEGWELYFLAECSSDAHRSYDNAWHSVLACSVLGQLLACGTTGVRPVSCGAGFRRATTRMGGPGEQPLERVPQGGNQLGRLSRRTNRVELIPQTHVPLIVAELRTARDRVTALEKGVPGQIGIEGRIEEERVPRVCRPT